MPRPVHSRLSTLATTTALATCGLVLVPVSGAHAAAPTATIVVADTALGVGETSLVTFTFSEAVTGFDNADLVVPHGTLGAVASSDGGVTWTATFTPSAGVTDTTNVITLDQAEVSDASAPPVAGVGTVDSNNFSIDTQRPTASIVLADSALAAGETTTVTVTFSEAVTGFTAADLGPENGTLAGLSSSDGGITWTATFTPTAAVDDETNVITLDNAGVADTAGNAGSGTTTSGNYVIDSVAPTATISLADPALTAGETSLVTITFSEPVSGFDNGDLTVPNGTLTGVASADGGTTWTATFTPTVDVTDATNVITLTNAGVTDVAGNAVTGTVASANFTIDTRRPAATIVVADAALAAGQTSLVTFTFGEAVTGFTNGDLTVPNGTLSAVSSSNGGSTWTATFTPSAGVNDPTNVITLTNAGVTDLAGNVGTGTSASNNYVLDSIRPTASIVVADSALSIGETATVTVSFSEAVTGFTNADLSIANGTLSALSSSNGGVTWVGTLTPATAVSDATNVITLANAGVTDVAGNPGTGSTTSNNYSVDTVRPTASIVLVDSVLGIGETSLVTVAFNEPVTGFTNADLSVANGTLSAVSTANGGMTWTATLTPTAGVNDTTNVITLANAGVSDVAGNLGAGTSTSNNYVIDSARPTSAIVVTDSTLEVGETSPVTVTFSEPVTGFTNADLTVANGALSPVTSTNGGVTWTATLTPSVATVDATNVITLANAGVQDLAGNTGGGTTTSNNYAVDTTPAADVVAPASAASGPAQTRNRKFRVNYVAADSASDVASVALFARAPGRAGFVKVATDAASQDGRFAFTGGADGTYAFYTVATDSAGNVEAAPVSPDHTTRLDTRAPVVTPAMGRGPLRFDLTDQRRLTLRFRADERVTYRFKVVRNGRLIRSFETKTSSRNVVKQGWNGRDDAGRRVKPGRYKVVLTATDAVGNSTTRAVRVLVTR